jgi:hypothetical protein
MASGARAAGRVERDHFPEINRRFRSAQYLAARQVARDLGLRRLDGRGRARADF